MRKIGTGLLLLLLMLTGAAHGTPPQTAAEAAPAKRPRIGVALAGGGARGFAHIGFLKWLEENRIPVDYIAGTSMGALVGAAYATGKSPREIAALVDNMNWNAVLSGEATYEELSFRRKQDRRQFPNAIEFGVRNKELTLPRGLISGHGVGLALDRIALPYGAVRSFDELPIPFRCVAIDLVKGEAVTFRDGRLSEALRATMAIPGIFSPVRRGAQLLVDGGLLNNLPAEALVEMGAEVVIAVQLSRLARDPNDLPLSGVVDSAIDVVLEQNERRSVEAARRKVRVIFLTLNVENFTTMDFTESRAIAALGERVPEAAAAELRQLAQKTRGDWDAWHAARAALVRPAPQAVSKIEVAAAKADARREIEADAAKGGAQPLEPNQLEKTLTRIFGRGRYGGIGYRVEDQQGQSTLQLDAKEKFHGPPFVKILTEVNGAETDDIQFNFIARITSLDVGAYGAEWRTDVSIGSRTALASEYEYPMGRSGFFLGPRMLAERASQSLFQNDDRVAEYLIDRTLAGFDVGYRFGRKDELRSGVEIGRINAEVRVGNPLLPRLEGVFSRTFMRWTHDGQDSPIVPRRGVHLAAEGSWWADAPGANGRFPQAELRSSAFLPVDKRGSIFLIVAGGTTFSELAPPAQAFTLGGPFRLGALGSGELRGDHFVYSAAGYIREIFRSSPPFGTRVHIGAWYEVGRVFEITRARGFYSNGSLGVVMETPLGPLFLGGSVGEEGRRKLYFKLGKFF